MKLQLVIILGVALSACANTSAMSDLSRNSSYHQTSLLFGDEPTPVKSHRECESIEGFLCFDVGSFYPFQVPSTKAQMLSLLTKNDVGPFGVEGRWTNGEWEYDAYRREIEFYGLKGDFFWIMIFLNKPSKRLPINLTIFSYEHGLLLNVPVREVMGVDAPILVPAPIIMTYKED